MDTKTSMASGWVVFSPRDGSRVSSKCVGFLVLPQLWSLEFGNIRICLSFASLGMENMEASHVWRLQWSPPCFVNLSVSLCLKGRRRDPDRWDGEALRDGRRTCLVWWCWDKVLNHVTDGLKIEESFKQKNDTKHLIESDLVQDSCNFFGVMWTMLVSASSLKQAFWLKCRSLLLVCCKNLSILILSGHVWPNSPNRSRVLRTGHGTVCQCHFAMGAASRSSDKRQLEAWKSRVGRRRDLARLRCLKFWDPAGSRP